MIIGINLPLIGMISYSIGRINEPLNYELSRVLTLLFSLKIKIVTNAKSTKLKHNSSIFF